MRQLLFAAFALVSVIGAKAQGNFTINGHIDGGLEGMKVYLRYGGVCYDENKEVLDSAVLHDGNFVLKGRLSSPVLCTIYFEDSIKYMPSGVSDNSKFKASLESKDRHEKIDKVLSLFVENSILLVQAFYDSLCLKKQFETHYSEKEGRLIPGGISSGFGTCRSAVVKGSGSHDLLMQFLNENQELFQKRGSLVYPTSNNTGNSVKVMDGLMKELKERVLQFVKSHAPGEVTGFIVLHLLDEFTCGGSLPDFLQWTTVDDIKQLTAPFAELKNKGPIVQELLQRAPDIAKGAMGARFIDFVFTDTSGVKHALSEYAGKGKYVLVDLWASWCSGCRNMLPHVKEVYGSYHSRGLDVISVSIDTKRENWIKAVKQEAMPWPQLAADLMSDAELKKGGKLAEYKMSLSPDDGNMLGVYMSSGVPLYLLFDPKGKLVSRFNLIPFLDQPLADLLGAPSPEKAQGGFQITGHIDGGLEGMKVYLRYGSIHYDEGKDNLDSTVLHDGNFVLKGKLASPALCTIFFEHSVQQGSNNKKVLSLFVENAAISVQALYDSLALNMEWRAPELNRLGVPDVLDAGFGISRSAMIKGSASHDLLMQFMNASWELVQKEKSVGDFFHILNGGVPAVKDLYSALNQIRDFTLRFVGSHPPGEVTAFIALYALYGEFLGSKNTADILACATGKDIEQLTAPFAAMEHKGLLARQLLEKAPAVAKVALGSRFIDLVMTDTNGVKHPLHDFVGKGRYVLVDMWASWCHACRAAIPHLKEAYAAYHPRGLDVIAVSIDANKADWIKAVKKEAMPWQQLASNLMTDGDLKKYGRMGDYEVSFFPGNIRSAYMFGGVPVVLLFDPQGKLIARSVGSPVAYMDKILDDLYGSAPSPEK